MKYWLIYCLILLLAIGCSTTPIPGSQRSQSIDPSIQTKSYIDQNSLSKNLLFTKVLRWATKYNLNLKSNILLSDRDSGTISIRYISRVTIGWLYYDCVFRENIYIEDGKIETVFTIERDETGFPFQDTFVDLGYTFYNLHKALTDEIST